MANVYGSSVNFSKELNVTRLYARVVFNPNGVAVLDVNSSKGVCAVNNESVAFTGATTNSVSVIGTISSFAGLFTGMTVTGSTGAIQANTTIGSMSLALGVGLNQVASATGNPVNLFATGGRYRFQFGYNTLSQPNLSAFPKLLHVQQYWDESTSSAVGTATSLALAPNNVYGFVVDNKVSVKTIPATATSGSTDCSIAMQFGTGHGQSFVARQPNTGDSVRLEFVFANSTAP